MAQAQQTSWTEKDVRSATTIEPLQIAEEYVRMPGDLAYWNGQYADAQEGYLRAKLRREAVLSDYYLGSVHAVTQEGDFIVASNTGSQLPHIVFTSKNLIFVVSTKKIVKNLDEAMERLIKHAYPLEDKKLMEKYNIHTGVSKIITFKGESTFSDRTISFFLVEQNLGY